MKKQVKIISTILLVVMILTSISSVVFASDISGAIEGMKTENTNSDVIGFGSKIVAILQTVGIVVAVVVLLILGIKYMMGSAEEKAEYKKTMIPYIIGAVLIFAATTIVNVIYQLSNTITGD